MVKGFAPQRKKREDKSHQQKTVQILNYRRDLIHVGNEEFSADYNFGDACGPKSAFTSHVTSGITTLNTTAMAAVRPLM